MEYQPGGDIFESDAEVIVNPVNCQAHKLKPGWQKGLAGAFETRFPGAQAPFKMACEKGQMKPGSVQLIGVRKSSGERAARGDADLLIAHVATKDHWREPSQIDWIDRGLEKLAGAVEDRGIRSVALPMLGAGLGKLPWEQVRERIEKHFGPLAQKGIRVMVMGEGPEREKAQESRTLEASAKVRRGWPEGTVFYAGIGARDTPEPVLRKMEKVAEVLAKKGLVVRSGAAAGADSAFERGARRVPGDLCEIYLPWDGFDPLRDGSKRMADGQTVFAENSKAHEDIAAAHHPKWDRLGKGPRAMMARNASQMLGRDLKTPSKMIICWTQGGEAVGGTGQSIRMAEDKGIQVINLGEERLKSLPATSLARIALQVAEGTKIGPAITRERVRRKKDEEAER